MDCYLVSFLLGPLMNIMACVLVLHTWGNFTAELTRFADREFHSVSDNEEHLELLAATCSSLVIVLYCLYCCGSSTLLTL